MVERKWRRDSAPILPEGFDLTGAKLGAGSKREEAICRVSEGKFTEGQGRDWRRVPFPECHPPPQALGGPTLSKSDGIHLLRRFSLEWREIGLGTRWGWVWIPARTSPSTWPGPVIQPYQSCSHGLAMGSMVTTSQSSSKKEMGYIYVWQKSMVNIWFFLKFCSKRDIPIHYLQNTLPMFLNFYLNIHHRIWLHLVCKQAFL